MGYTHYWYRIRTLDKTKFHDMMEDFKKFLPMFKVHGIKLAGGLGEGEPKLNDDAAWFNGDARCGHQRFELGIAWPTEKPKNGVAVSSKKAAVGSWFAGASLEQRTCGGDCSHETFDFPRYYKSDFEQRNKENPKQFFSFCKTAFKPYDLAVQIFLVVAKHYFSEAELVIHSDGTPAQWVEAVAIVHNELGYDDFILEGKPIRIDEMVA